MYNSPRSYEFLHSWRLWSKMLLPIAVYFIARKKTHKHWAQNDIITTRDKLLADIMISYTTITKFHYFSFRFKYETFHRTFFFYSSTITNSKAFFITAMKLYHKTGKNIKHFIRCTKQQSVRQTDWGMLHSYIYV